MIWFPLSLLAALSLATVDAMTKRFFGNQSPYEMALVRLLKIDIFICMYYSSAVKVLRKENS